MKIEESVFDLARSDYYRRGSNVRFTVKLYSYTRKNPFGYLWIDLATDEIELDSHEYGVLDLDEAEKAFITAKVKASSSYQKALQSWRKKERVK